MENYTQNNVQGAYVDLKSLNLIIVLNAERYVTRIQTLGSRQDITITSNQIEDNETYNTKSYIWPVKDYEEAKNRLRGVGGHKTSRSGITLNYKFDKILFLNNGEVKFLNPSDRKSREIMNGYLLNLEPSNLQSGPSGETELADSRNWFEENKEKLNPMPTYCPACQIDYDRDYGPNRRPTRDLLEKLAHH